MSDLRAFLVERLTALAAAHEHSMTYPELPTLPPRDGCAECGSDDKAWPLKVSATARCTGCWHNS